MPITRDGEQLLRSIEQGRPPPPRMAASSLFGMDSVLAAWRQDLELYVGKGGSLVRIVSAPVGAGKTHLGLALKAIAAELGFLVCQVDVQAQSTASDDLALYQAFCSGLQTPAAFLGDQTGNRGLRGVVDDVVTRFDRDAVSRGLRQARLPIQAVAEVLGDLIEVVRDSDGSGEHAINTAFALLSGAKVGQSVAALRRSYPGELKHFGKRPTGRNARLWQESMMVALRGLGYPGVVVVVDEHDQNSKAKLDASVVQLRREMDRLAEGQLPGSFVLYLTLDDFAIRLQDHEAVRQRVEPILHESSSTSLLVRLDALRDRRGRDFLAHVGGSLYQLIAGESVPASFGPLLTAMAAKYERMEGCATRDFVKELAMAIEA